MVKLFCYIVGQKGSAFSVDIDDNACIGDLKKLIKEEKANGLKDIDSRNLELYLAITSDKKWLDTGSNDAKRTEEGENIDVIEELIQENLPLNPELVLQDVLEKNQKPGSMQIQILVVIPENLTSQNTRFLSDKILTEPELFFKTISSSDEKARWVTFYEKMPSTSLKKLYVRKSFKIIAQQILKQHTEAESSVSETGKTRARAKNAQFEPIMTLIKAVITGTPGIGKSLFLLYLLQKLVKQSKRVLYVYNPFIIYFDGNGSVLAFPEIKTIPSNRNDFWNDTLWCLFDAKGQYDHALGDIPYSKCHFILSTAPRRHLVNDFMKPPVPEEYYMPVWSRYEMGEIASLFENSTNWESRFEVLGGVPRFVLENTTRNPTEILEQACDDCDLDRCIRRISLNSIISGKSKVIHHLIHVTSHYPYSQSSVCYASTAAIEIIVKKKLMHVKRDLESFLRCYESELLYSSICGHIFELHVAKILGKGGTFTCRELVHGTVKDRTPDTSITIPSSNKIIVKKVELNQTELKLDIPQSENFTEINAWIPGIGVFHITVGKRHKMNKKTARYLQILGKEYDFYWFLDDTNYHTFTKDNPLEIRHYTMCLPNPEFW
jgi:hypothetical protein